MKKYFVFFTMLFALNSSMHFLYAQQDSIYNNDALLLKVKNLLPAGWSMNSHKDTLIIQREDSAYVSYENRINAPVSRETRDEVNKRIIKNGIREKPRFVFRYYTKLDSSEIATSKVLSITLQKIIYSLPEKYEIEHLLDKFAISKGEEIYVGKTNEDNERIENYYKEKNKLLNEIPRLPDFNSEKYSLYLEMIIGSEDQMHLVYPYEVSTEMYSIRKILDENLIIVK
jgi:hypothetical protein